MPKTWSDVSIAAKSISRMKDFTQIDYRSNTSDNVELFGFYADKGLENSETLTYMQNDKIIVKITFITQNFDETGVKYSAYKKSGRKITETL